jgi:hypothetical protein
MTQRETDAERQHMLHMVESALRAGRTEHEVREIVDEAVESDAEFDRAA